MRVPVFFFIIIMQIPIYAFCQKKDTISNPNLMDSITIVNIIDKKIMEQNKKAKKQRDTVNYSAKGRSIAFKVLLQNRYAFSTTPNIDVNGSYYADSVKGINNSFAVKRARFFIIPKINDHFDANIMLDLAEFSSTNVSGKVIDNAYIHYGPSKNFNVRGGLFRPNLGIEDVVPVDLIRSLDYSNGYYAMGKSGWYSFQTGVEIYGALPLLEKWKLKYYAGILNGNGKGQAADNDRLKHYYGRITTDVIKNMTIGVAGGVGSSNNHTGHMFSADLNSEFHITPKWLMVLSSEYRDGTNFSDFSTAYTANRNSSIDRFNMRDFYIFPEMRYEYSRSRLRGIDFAIRYEYFDPSYKISKNPQTTLTPLVGLMFADDYFSTLQLGININMFKHQIENSATRNNNLWVLQWQIRY